MYEVHTVFDTECVREKRYHFEKICSSFIWPNDKVIENLEMSKKQISIFPFTFGILVDSRCEFIFRRCTYTLYYAQCFAVVAFLHNLNTQLKRNSLACILVYKCTLF